MRRFFILISLLFMSYYCFSQQNMPSIINGRVPSSNCTQTYQIQVGAYRINSNASNAMHRLRSIGLNPVCESYYDYTRVMITNIPANLVRDHLVRIKSIGFDEVIIREIKDHRQVRTCCCYLQCSF